MSNQEIAKLRDALVDADGELVQALERRLAAVRRFAALKEASPELYGSLPSTEQVVASALEASSFPAGPLERALRELLGACDAVLAPVAVAVLGPEGGFADAVARRHFGSSASLHSRPGIARVFEDVERKRVTYGVVPLESSTDGARTETLDALVRSGVRIAAEVTLSCTHDLVSATGNEGDVEKIYGTAQAFGACDQRLAQVFPKATRLEVLSGSVAEELAAEDHGAAAVIVGGREPHDLESGGLRLVLTRIEDQADLETRFVVISHERPSRTGTDRTLVALAAGDQPGSLHETLRPFAERGINLTRIESRPSRGTRWRYLFILELDGHITDRPVMTAIDEVRGVSRHLEILGSFPRPVRDA
ncbi:MAG: bifunctional chorismate mutase/prephenate dehydratase [Sandaracinaceae bacterium]